MTAETLKPFIASTTANLTKSHPNNNFKPKTMFGNTKSLIIFIITSLFLILCIIACNVQIWNMRRIMELQEESANVKQSLEKLRKQFGLHDLEEFENAYGQLDSDLEISAKFPPTSSDDLDDDDDGYDLDQSAFGSYETGDSEDDDDDDYDGSGASDSYDDDEYDESDDADLMEKMSDDNILEDSKKRKPRSIAGITHQGVPILEEPYVPNRNRTVKPTSILDDHVTHILLPVNKQKEGRLRLKWDSNSRREYLNEKQQVKYQNRHHHNQYQSPHRMTENRIPLNQENKKINLTQTQTTNTPPKVYSRKSRVMMTDDGTRQAPKQVVIRDENGVYNRYLDFRKAPDQYVVHPRRRVHHSFRKNLEMKNNRRSRRLAAHFNGDFDLQLNGREHSNHHQHNHPHRKPKLVLMQAETFKWKPSNWMQDRQMNQYFKMDNGVLTIHDEGLYFVYAQVLYDSNQTERGFVVNHNNQMALECKAIAFSNHHSSKTNTCYTSGLIELTEGDELRVNEIGSDRTVVLESGKSFFGLFKVVLTQQ